MCQVLCVKKERLSVSCTYRSPLTFQAPAGMPWPGASGVKPGIGLPNRAETAAAAFAMSTTVVAEAPPEASSDR